MGFTASFIISCFHFPRDFCALSGQVQAGEKD